MIQPIVRVYETAQQAQNVMNELKANGFGGELSNQVSPREPAQSAEDIAKAIRIGYVLKGYASAYAACVLRGLTVVSVRAPIGTGRAVTAILDSFGPVASGIDAVAEQSPTWDEAAPISSALNMPVTIHGAAPFSSFWKLPVLLREGKRYRPVMGNTGSARNPAPFSALLGLPMLARNAAPLSSMLGLPLLTKGRSGRR